MDATDRSDEALVAYVPVIQRGYVELFQKHPSADMHVLDQDVLDQFGYLRKDIRALAPGQAARLIESMCIFPRVVLLGRAALTGVATQYPTITMPADDISDVLAQEYFSGSRVIFEPAFLRWDRLNIVANVEFEADRVVQATDREDRIIRLIYEEAGRSTNIWRRVGAAIVREGEVVFSAHNTHLPTPYSPLIDGDPRSTLKRGMGVEFSTDEHAEAIVIGEAARQGTPLEGTTIYVDTFPCPPCAKLVARSGFRSLYFVEGYAMVDGLSVIRNAGIEVVKVETSVERPVAVTLPYPEK